MAKRRRKGTGGVVQVRKLNGLGALGKPNTVAGSLLPVAIGGGVTTAVMVGIRSTMEPDTEMKVKLLEHAPWVGLAAGLVSSAALWSLSSQHAGAVSAVAGGVVALSAVIGEAAAKARMEAPVSTAGVRAIVPEYSRRGTGALLFERAGTGAAQRGANVRLNGLSKINVAAFGVPGFQVG